MSNGWADKLESEQNKELRLVHLIEMGNCPAVKAKDLKAGMTRYYNFGYGALITEIQIVKGWVYVTTEEDGKQYTRKHKPETLIPIKMQRVPRGQIGRVPVIETMPA